MLPTENQPQRLQGIWMDEKKKENENIKINKAEQVAKASCELIQVIHIDTEQRHFPSLCLFIQ